MARKRSAQDSVQKQTKVREESADESMQSDQERAAASAPDVVEKQRANRDLELALREREKNFITETEKIKVRLLKLQKANPNLFGRLFGFKVLVRSGSSLTAFRPDKIAEWLAEAKDDDQKQILKDFWFYTARFRVWLAWDFKKADFKRPSPFPPYATKFRARLVNGRLQLMQPYAPELTYESQYEDSSLSVLDPALEKWLTGGRAMLVRLEDAKGHSLLNELESFAYDPNAVTLIVHNSVMPYLFLLVGEMAQVDDMRAAGTLLTSLRKRSFGSKAGKPKDLVKYRQAIQKLKEKDGKSQKAKAFDLLSGPADRKKLRSAEVSLSKTKKTIKP